MADDLTLAIILKTILDAKGFEEAQANLKNFTASANSAQTPVKGLTKELGGSRGAVADMTRVLLMNIGVTGAAGNVAKAAGAGINALGGAAGALSFGFAGVVAVAALVIPKLLEMGKSSKEAAEEARRLTDAAIEQLPELETLAEKIGKVNKALELQVEAVRKQALDKQAETIAQYTRQIIALEQEASDLAIKIEKVGFGLERAAPGSATAKRVEEYKEQLRKLNLEIDRQSAVLLEMQNAQDKSATSEAIRTQQTEDAAEAARRAEKADRERNKALADQLQLERDLIRESGRLQQQENKDRAEARKKREEDLKTATAMIVQIEGEKGAHLANARAAIQARKDQTTSTVAAYAQMGAALSTFFGNNKALAIAAAIADTYAGATAALGMKPWTPLNFAMAAAVIATGLANVANIRKAQPGFDDPFNDLLAEKLGRKSAADFVRYFGVGFQSGMMGGGGGTSNIYNNSTTINRGVTLQGGLHSHSIVGSSATNELKQLERKLINIRRLEGRTTVGRR